MIVYNYLAYVEYFAYINYFAYFHYINFFDKGSIMKGRYRGLKVM